jgi:hypothetical protein
MAEPFRVFDPISFESHWKLTGVADFKYFVHVVEIVIHGSQSSPKFRGNLFISQSFFESQGNFSFLEWSQTFQLFLP